ncbi:MAG: carboxypeptidase regulatory-like domain-containing protein [Chitinophagales bacterium]|nr:carboxypeptidase regulatory-like domain-containing protein [Chitinophagales bacterium]
MLQKKYWLGLLGLALAFLWVACNKDLQNNSNWPGKTVQTTFIGRVTDANGNAVSGATASVGTLSTTTDNNGVFRIENASVNSSRAKITIEKNGYWTNIRTLFVNKDATYNLRFTLLPETVIANFNSANGTTLSVSNASLRFDAGSISRDGQTYNGTVVVSGAYINPEADNLLDIVPGALRGLRSNGEEELLQTFGMVGIRLSDPAGNPLQIAAGKTVEMTATIPSGLLAQAPDEVPMWHFDETEGLWKEEGVATKTGNQYKTSVSHFSWWNYDASAPSILLSGRVVDQNGNPISQVHVWACPETINIGMGCGHGSPDISGNFSGLAPKGVQIRIEIYSSDNSQSPCNNIIHSQLAGPFNTDTDLGNIVVDLNSLPGGLVNASVSGRILDCDGQPVANGYAFITRGVGVLATNANGEFNGNLTYCSNNVPGNISATGVDMDNLKESLEKTQLVSGNINFGDLSACNNLENYVVYSLDGGSNITLPITNQDSAFISQEYVSLFAADGNNLIQFAFGHNAVVGSSHPLQYIGVNGFWSNTINVTTTITDFPPQIGGYMTGTFSGTFTDSGGNTHTVNGNYRIRRNI